MRRARAAACVLAASAVGAAAGYSLRANFWGGLFFSGCLAAMIGGLADWFAVTALFRRPLGIAYRTEVIPRNRQRLLREILVFIGEDLLRPRNIVRVAGHYNMAALLLRYFERDDGKEKLRRLSEKLAVFALRQVDKKAIAELLVQAAQRQVDALHPERLLLANIRGMLRAGKEEALLRFLLSEAQLILRDPAVYGMLVTVIGEMKGAYEERHARRQWLTLLLDLSPDRLAAAVRDRLVAASEALKDPAHPHRQALSQWLCEQSAQWAADGTAPLWRKLRAQLAQVLPGEIETWLSGEASTLAQRLQRMAEAQIEAIKRDAALQRALDRRLKFYVARLVRSRHSVVTALIEERLAEFTDASLVAFLEARVADDLQMIRINGSAVGAAAGMLLYLLQACAESVW